MATRWEMSEKLGTVQLAPRENPYLGGNGGYAGEKPFGEETARAIDEEARRLLTQHRGELEALAQALLERETLDEEEILQLTGLAPRAWRTRRSRPRARTRAETLDRDLRNAHSQG